MILPSTEHIRPKASFPELALAFTCIEGRKGKKEERTWLIEWFGWISVMNAFMPTTNKSAVWCFVVERVCVCVLCWCAILVLATAKPFYFRIIELTLCTYEIANQCGLFFVYTETKQRKKQKNKEERAHKPNAGYTHVYFQLSGFATERHPYQSQFFFLVCANPLVFRMVLCIRPNEWQFDNCFAPFTRLNNVGVSCVSFKFQNTCI